MVHGTRPLESGQIHSYIHTFIHNTLGHTYHNPYTHTVYTHTHIHKPELTIHLKSLLDPEPAFANILLVGNGLMELEREGSWSFAPSPATHVMSALQKGGWLFYYFAFSSPVKKVVAPPFSISTWITSRYYIFSYLTCQRLATKLNMTFTLHYMT